ncbi:MAG: DUF4912 domain-containing protein [Candidatus Omnitrophota bacterium]
MKRIISKIKASLKKAVGKRSTILRKVHVKVSAKAGRHTKKTTLSRKQTTITAKTGMPIEIAVAESKFYIPSQARQEKRDYLAPVDLPLGYAQDRIVLQVRDPLWIHAYWEITKPTEDRLKQEFSGLINKGFRKVLRVYDVTDKIFTGDNPNHFFDIEITPAADNWYINTKKAGRSWCVDLGLILDDGRFITIVRSNTVSTPLDGPSDITDEKWMIPDDIFARFYGMGIGTGSSPFKLKKGERFKREFGSGGLFSGSIPAKKKKVKGFWLVVNTELIVYGSTQPDANVTVAGQPVKLRPDGSFSVRFLLPDGKQVIPVVATSSDGEQKRKITPIVTKETS